MNLPDRSIIAGLCLVVLVVVINIGLFYSLRSKNTREQIDLLRKAGSSAKNPWQAENDSIDELSEKVTRLEIRRERGDHPTIGSNTPQD